MFGTFVNAGAIVIGALIGLALKAGIPRRFRDIVMQGLGLAVALIGLKMAFSTNNVLIVILSLVLGGAVGEALDIEKRLDGMGSRLKDLIKAQDGGFGQGFVTATLVYCVGAMSIMGALESGLTGQHKILLAKSTIDGFSAVVFASTMGAGVAFSALSVLVYQGGITLMAEAVRVLMTEAVLAEMTATGGILIVAIALNMLEIKQFKVANFLPAVFVAIALAALAAKIPALS